VEQDAARAGKWGGHKKVVYVELGWRVIDVTGGPAFPSGSGFYLDCVIGVSDVVEGFVTRRLSMPSSRVDQIYT
jgi:hypothetical protein